MSEDRKVMSNKRLGFLIDTRYCNNCKTCEIACKMERRLPEGIRWREVRRFEANLENNNEMGHCLDGHKPYALNVPMSCNHCEKPQCVEVCPMNTYRKLPNGIVMQYNNYCIGCTKCVAACPYSAPVYNPATGRTGKCDMCYDRLEAGLQPYCVTCCPSRALKLGIYENFVAAYGARQDIAEFDNGTVVPIANVSSSGGGSLSTTNPSIVIKVFD